VDADVAVYTVQVVRGTKADEIRQLVGATSSPCAEE